MPNISRRRFIGSGAAAAGWLGTELWPAGALAFAPLAPLQALGYGDVELHSVLHEQQLEQTLSVLMSLNEDSLLKPFRQMTGQSAPGDELGGWYSYDPANIGLDGAYAPSATFGQWISALARMYAIRGTPDIRAKTLRLNRLYAQTIDGSYYENNRFPAYCYDKLLRGLLDSHQHAGDADAYGILERTTDAALPHLPGRAIENGVHWRAGKDSAYDHDESYTNSEHLFMAYRQGAGERYKALAIAYLDEPFYDPLSENRSNLSGRHAYSYVNSLSSAMQAYLTLGSEKHLRAARNGFAYLQAQSFASGGWGPDETLRAPGGAEVFQSLTNTHKSFETPCGAYAHFKLTRYLLTVTRDPGYGDSMERMMYNTILGAKPLLADGRTFYYADYSNQGRKVYSDRRWPCCSGTMPQVAADYRINVYFRDAQGLYVNLYVPSTARWSQDGARVALTQRSEYPFDDAIEFEVRLSKPAEFALAFRIPAWASGASLQVNGRGMRTAAPGGFALVRRHWKSGDRVELELPLRMRLEALDANHPRTVALLSGPLVLFPLGEDLPTMSEAQLLSARKTGARTWSAAADNGALALLPFTAIDEEPYATYLTISR